MLSPVPRPAILGGALFEKGEALTYFVQHPTHARRANVHNHSNLERHVIDRQSYRERRSAALAEWQTLAA